MIQILDDAVWFVLAFIVIAPIAFGIGLGIGLLWMAI